MLALQRRSLIQRIGFLLQQSQIVQWVEDHFLAGITACMLPDHFTAARNDQVLREGFHQHLTVSVLGRH
jgi:hypothetical protein